MGRKMEKENRGGGCRRKMEGMESMVVVCMSFCEGLKEVRREKRRWKESSGMVRCLKGYVIEVEGFCCCCRFFCRFCSCCCC